MRSGESTTLAHGLPIGGMNVLAPEVDFVMPAFEPIAEDLAGFFGYVREAQSLGLGAPDDYLGRLADI